MFLVSKVTLTHLVDVFKHRDVDNKSMMNSEQYSYTDAQMIAYLFSTPNYLEGSRTQLLQGQMLSTSSLHFVKDSFGAGGAAAATAAALALRQRRRCHRRISRRVSSMRVGPLLQPDYGRAK